MGALDTSGPNAEQIEFWNGEVGTTWAENNARMDELLEPLSRDALAALNAQRGERVLDVGCGCGDTTLRIAEVGALPTGIDISAPMLAQARRRAAERKLAAEFVLADATTHRFDRRFDALFSRFGVMFFADPVAAFTNLRRSLAANARLTFVCWQEPRINTWMALPMAAARPHLPEQPAVDPRAPGPFAFADRTHVNEILTRAGFSSVSIDPLDAALSLGGSVDEALTFTVKVGPLSRALLTAEPAARERAIAAVGEALRNEAKDGGGIRLPARCWIVRARA
jgi:SAM-dependent methyltransferase